MCRDEHWNMGTLRAPGARTSAVAVSEELLHRGRMWEQGGASAYGLTTDVQKKGLRDEGLASLASGVYVSLPHPGPAHGSET